MDQNELYKQKTKELTLLLLYLSSWVEKEGSFTSQRAWKGYDFGILDELNEEQLIFGSNRSKSIYFTDKGIQEARELIKKFVPELEGMTGG